MKINEAEIKKAIETLHPNNQLFEIRVIGHENGYKKILSGYFTDYSKAIEELKKCNVVGNVFITLNQINGSCYNREQHDKLLKVETTTQDKEIVNRDYLLIDLDPERIVGTSSTDEEKQHAIRKADEIISYTDAMGLYRPIKADSGNGIHLIYKVDITEGNKLIERVLKHFDELFTDANVKIDTKVGNLARICKLYGTYARKGANTETAPHRLAHIIEIPEAYHSRPNTSEILERVAVKEEELETQRTIQNNYSNSNGYTDSPFDLQEFIQKHNIPVKQVVNVTYGTKYILEQCLFDPSHKGKDAMILQLNNGALAYSCFHNSCKGKSWKTDVRPMFEPNYNPDAYTHAHREPQTRYSDYNTTNYTQTVTTQHRGADSVTEATEQPTQDTRVSDYMQNGYKEDLERFKRSITGLSTGFEKLDYHLGGCINVGLYVLGAISSLGKTTLVHQIADNIANQKRDVLYFSLEMSRLELVTKSVAREQAKALLNEGKSCLEQEGKASIEIRKGYGNEHTKEATAKYMMHKAKYMHIYEADINTCTADAIISNIKSFIERNPDAKPVIFVDYLQIIQQEPTAKVVDTKTHLDRTIVKFKQLSRDINAPIFLISSINRANYLSLIDFESFKETGAIEYTADVVLGLQLQVMKHDVFNSSTKLNHKRELVRVAKKEPQRKVELVCLKNRYANSSFTSYFEYYSKYDLFEEKEEASEVLLFAEAFDDLQAEYEDLEAQGYTYLKMKANGHYNE